VCILQFFGIEDSGLPALVIQDKDDNAKYVANNIKASDMSAWLQDFQVNSSLKNFSSYNNSPLVYTLTVSAVLHLRGFSFEVEAVLLWCAFHSCFGRKVLD
jgi:hypothetical protein